MTDDSPEDRLGELFSKAYFPGHPLGLSIAGTPKIVKTFGGDLTRKYHKKMLSPRNIVIAAAGNVKHEIIVRLARKAFGGESRLKPGLKARRPVPAAPIVIKQNPTLEQAHLILATPFVSGRDKRRYAADLLSDILGGGTSSRLWQKVREERGLAYSVGASTIMFNDCGMFTVSAGTSPEQMVEVVDITVKEMRDVVEHGVTEEELELTKQQTRASVLMSLEDSASRAASLAESEMLHGRQISVEESLANTEAVTRKEVQNLAKEFFRTEKVAFAVLGNLKGLKVNRKRLAI
jgi:predicted Zn-dependent peptidase